MGLKPSTRNFLLAAASVALLVPALLILAMLRLWRAGLRGGAVLEQFWIAMAMGLAVTIMGILIAWLRLRQDRKERASRRPPLVLD
jgi:hypothetical protein